MSTPLSPTPRPFDSGPLIDPVDPAIARDYVKMMRLKQGTQSVHTIMSVVAVTIFAIVALLILIPVLIGALFMFEGFQQLQNGGPIANALFVLVVIIVFGGLGFVVFLLIRSSIRKSNERLYRLYMFAEANGMHFIPRETSPPLPGMIFGIGSERQAKDILRGTHPRFAEFGNYEYTTGSGKNKTTHSWGYVAVHLDVPLPHIVLDAVGNNSLFGSNLPTRFARGQRLDLEGDFNKYFALYCPEGYEQDALYLFPPDIMARFVDFAAELDVEIVDNWLFLYSRREFTSLDPATWAWLFSTVGAMMSKFTQWARWRDDRLHAEHQASVNSDLPFEASTQFVPPPPGVAAGGRRLKSNYSWGVIVGIVISAAWFFLSMLSGR
jgi:hypothetical protein